MGRLARQEASTPRRSCLVTESVPASRQCAINTALLSGYDADHKRPPFGVLLHVANTGELRGQEAEILGARRKEAKDGPDERCAPHRPTDAQGGAGNELEWHCDRHRARRSVSTGSTTTLGSSDIESSPSGLARCSWPDGQTGRAARSYLPGRPAGGRGQECSWPLER